MGSALYPRDQSVQANERPDSVKEGGAIKEPRHFLVRKEGEEEGKEKAKAQGKEEKQFKFFIFFRELLR